MSGVNYSYDVYHKNPQWIYGAKANNLTLNVWTIDDSYNIIWFLKNNFDAITTSEPELALNYQATLNNIDFTFSKLNVKVFPNPTSNLLWIQSDSLVTIDFKVEILNELGKVVIAKTFEREFSTYSFETATLNNGVYFFKIIGQESSKTYKIIINH